MIKVCNHLPFRLPPQHEYGHLFLGHTRLSIIDLSVNGHQPMASPDGRYTFVFNGEIYNYREIRDELQTLGYKFYTDSDTEVLITAWSVWGYSCLRRFTGMFAFVVFDNDDYSLTLVRDAFGIKPLFFSIDQNSFGFASEIPALINLLAVSPKLNFQNVYDYLAHGRYDHNSQSFYSGIYHLLPGHHLRLDLQVCPHQFSKGGGIPQ